MNWRNLYLKMNTTTYNLAQLAQPKLADALAEHIMNRQADSPQDSESRKYLLHDLNGLLSTAGPGAELSPKHLANPTLLRAHLQSSLEIPAQVLAKELPNRLGTWLKQEPPANPANPVAQSARAAWAEGGRTLLDQARLNPSSMA